MEPRIVKMDPAIKAAWLEALRSGDYDKGIGCLKRGMKFCCLGVLCDLAVEAGVVEWTEPKPHTLSPDYDDGQSLIDGEGMILPPSVTKWAGLTGSTMEVVTDEGEWKELVTLNDDNDLPFTEIADFIEDQF